MLLIYKILDHFSYLLEMKINGWCNIACMTFTYKSTIETIVYTVL